MAFKDRAIAKAYHKAYYQKRAEEWRQRAREWRASHPEIEKAAKKRYYLKHKPTILAQRKKWHENNKRRVKNTVLLKVYGITLEEYEEMVKVQKGGCGVCGYAEKKLVVDHNHSTKKVRELLCMNCNIALGNAKESVAVLEALIAYIKRHEERI